jgi:hypothetical protein
MCDQEQMNKYCKNEPISERIKQFQQNAQKTRGQSQLDRLQKNDPKY